MKRAIHVAAILMTAFDMIVLPGCKGDFTQDNFSVEPMQATIGYTTAIHDELISLPEPKEKIVVAVYKFRDQTGQYKTSANATTFSTAVTQGATSMLNKSLQDSGWFIPIEREGLPNLLNERKIIRSSRLQYQSETGDKVPALPPLLYAGVLLEGGIVSYDTNFISGGLGIKYFGVGGSGQLRKDRVTIYLRLVSVKNGQVLKTVSTTKSILSKEVDFGVYRFVSVKRLFEAETGYSTNEPPSMCVLEAIEKAVYSLIIEGIEDGIWSLKNPQDINSPVIQSYFEERKLAEKLVAFDKEGDLMDVEGIEKQISVLSHLENLVREAEDEDIEEPDVQTIEKATMVATETAEAEIQVIPEMEPNKIPEGLKSEFIVELQPEVNKGSEVENSVVGNDKIKPILVFLQEAIGKSKHDDDGKSVVLDGEIKRSGDSGGK